MCPLVPLLIWFKKSRKPTSFGGSAKRQSYLFSSHHSVPFLLKQAQRLLLLGSPGFWPLFQTALFSIGIELDDGDISHKAALLIIARVAPNKHIGRVHRVSGELRLGLVLGSLKYMYWQFWVSFMNRKKGLVALESASLFGGPEAEHQNPNANPWGKAWRSP